MGGRYRLEDRLGFGGMSEVWLAEDTELERRVAIKLLGIDADAERFNREARAVAALAHPNICRLYDFGEDKGRPFMVLEYLPGGTLEDRLVTGDPSPDGETRRIAVELASALAHAHDRGLVHRDLKPANVLFDEDGRAKIADFGIARLSGARTLTEAGTLLGTAAYISPEQASGLPATPASDVYSFGVILYRLVAGRLPFEAGTALELAEMHVRDEPPPLRALRPDAPTDLAEVAQAALAKDPDARPPDGAALLALLGGEPTAATMIGGSAAAQTVVLPRGRRAGLASDRRRVALLVVAAVVLLAAAGVAAAVLATRSSSDSQTTTRHRPARRTTTRATSTGATSHVESTTRRATTTPSTTRRTTAPPPPAPPPPTPPPPPPTPPPTPPPPPTTVPSVSVPTIVTTPPPPPPSP